MFKTMIALFIAVVLTTSFAPVAGAEPQCDRHATSSDWNFRGC
jgi:hypothetical protein